MRSNNVLLYYQKIFQQKKQISKIDEDKDY